MLIELLSSSNYVNFNVKLAQILGLKSAIYLSQIMDINEKAIRKNKIDKNFFTIDRKYVESRTTLTKEEQINIEKTLLTLGILKKVPEHRNMISLDITVITSIMMSPDEDLIKEIADTSKSREAKTKAKNQAIENALKDNVITTNHELQEAYYAWIEGVLAKDGYMTKAAVTSAQIEIDKFSNRNLDVALEVLRIAAVNGYRDIMWAITRYVEDSNARSKARTATPVVSRASLNEPSYHPVKVSDEIF